MNNTKLRSEVKKKRCTDCGVEEVISKDGYCNCCGTKQNGGLEKKAVRCYQIDFSNHLRCKIEVTDTGIEVVGAMNGWGDGVPLDEVVIVAVQ